MKRLISYMLAICMIASFFVGAIPQTARAAGEVIITDAAMLQYMLDHSTETDFVLAESLRLDQTLVIPAGREITIRGPKDPRLTISVGGENWPLGDPLIKVSAGATVTFQNFSINGATGSGNDLIKCAQGIVVEIGGASVTLNSVSIFYCNGGTKSGAGLSVGGAFQGNKAELTLDGCVFWGNVTSLKSATCGGAIYIGSNYKATMKKVEFDGNEAHSGGCMYITYSNVLAENCKFGYNGGTGDSNRASQRGGAIHCHGTLVLKDSVVCNNLCEQNGGGIYISSNEESQALVLDDYSERRFAQRTGLPQKTIKNGKARAIRKLRRQLLREQMK